MAPKKETPTPPTTDDDDSKLDALLDRAKARERERERKEKIGTDANLETEERTLVFVYKTPCLLKDILRPSKYARPEDIVRIPEDARLWPGSAVRVPDGFGRVSREIFREATSDEIENLVTANVAASFLETEAPVLNAAALLKATEQERDRREAAVEKVREALAEAERLAADGRAMVGSATGNLEAKQATFASWIEASGRPEEALRRAAELLMRKPEPEPSKGYALSAGHELDGETWRQRLDRTNREADKVQNVVSVGGVS